MNSQIETALSKPSSPWVEYVRDFHKASGANDSATPKLPDWDSRNLRMRLIDEEVSEYLEAEETGGLPEIAKELGDIIYVCIGALLKYGVDPDDVMDEIQRSNMSKFVDGKAVRREDGKIMKGPNYQPADIKRVLYGV